ncbi:MAG: hypothetical protein OEX02_17005 [Cyclobacteriaceae bacterium]|nr:hypothetical protein [Cyclobacteriaceae bacterium]
MLTASKFERKSIGEKVNLLYKDGTFIMSIRYYRHKVNLYLLSNFFVEVFYNHKLDKIDKVDLLDDRHSRMKFYADQIKLSLTI